jgi:hypothetical protein
MSEQTQNGIAAEVAVATPPEKLNASVKVMRSHDYCHFEVQLSSPFPVSIAEIDELRKKAARLTDKAVEQYKVAKQNASLVETDEDRREYQESRIKRYREIPEGERTPEEQAAIKQFEDSEYQARRRYDYDDDWED